jgi:alginate O-acetyltransferase complex protein AlgJ
VKSLIGKFALLAAPFVALVAIELFVLPVDFFTFRVWEALTMQYVRPAEGIFYPKMHVVKNEHADRLGFRDPNPKKVEWFTDEYGFRNRPRAIEPERYDIVVVGDSNIAGSSHDQKDTIAEVLERKCRCPVYSYGGASKRQFFNDPRFKHNSPRVIVAEAIGAEFYQESFAALNYANLLEGPGAEQSWLPDPLAVMFDRLLKTNMLEYVRSRLHVQRYAAQKEPETPSAERVSFVVEMVTKMRDEAARRGSDFIFVLMPYDATLDQAVVKLKQLGVKTIAYLPSPERPQAAYLKSFYQDHDTHWRVETVRTTADDILDLLGWTNARPENQTDARSVSSSAQQ